MTAKENVTLQEFIDEYRRDKADDAVWKADVTEKLTPLVDERMDRLVVQKYGVKAFKVLAFCVGFLASMGAAWKYLLAPFFGYK